MMKYAALLLWLLLPAAPAAAGIKTEYKVLIEPSSWAAAAAAYGLAGPDKERNIYFFDTPNLDLYAQGLVLRARAGKKKADITVKYRPPAGAIPAQVSARPGFKCENDASATGSVYSCSLSESAEPAAVAAAAAGANPRGLYSAEQRLWAGERPWEALKALGPIRSTSWETAHPALGELSFERWDLPGGPSFLEASFRADEDGGAGLASLVSEFRARGIAPAAAQMQKTRAAMTFFAR
jgi:hypothetical protein